MNQISKVDLALHMAFNALEDVLKYEGGAKCACEDSHVMERVCDAYEHLNGVVNAGKIYMDRHKND